MTGPIPVMKPWLGTDEQEAVAATVASGWVAQGPRVAEFEQAVAARLGVGHAVAVSSCTTALHLALVLHGVGPGDEVVVPSLSFIATANCVHHAGATPVFAEVDPTTMNVDAATIEPCLTPRTRAVIAVHQAGVPADLDGIHALCDPRGVAVVEDAACALGATHRGVPVGASELATFSFHPRKVITTGEGGMLTTVREDWARRARRLREHGMDLSAADRHASTEVRYESYLEVAFNYRMTDIQAALGLVQLGKLDAMVARRRELATAYTEALADLPVRLPADPPWGTTNVQSCWMVLEDGTRADRDRVLSGLAEREIFARRGIMATHVEPAYGLPPGSLPVTERLADTSLILPLFHEMTASEQERVVTSVRDLLGAP